MSDTQDTGGSQSKTRVGHQGFENPERLRTDCDERNAYTVYHHLDCGKEWQEKPDDYLPHYCPNCGERL